MKLENNNGNWRATCTHQGSLRYVFFAFYTLFFLNCELSVCAIYYDVIITLSHNQIHFLLSCVNGFKFTKCGLCITDKMQGPKWNINLWTQQSLSHTQLQILIWINPDPFFQIFWFDLNYTYDTTFIVSVLRGWRPRSWGINIGFNYREMAKETGACIFFQKELQQALQPCRPHREMRGRSCAKACYRVFSVSCGYFLPVKNYNEN